MSDLQCAARFVILTSAHAGLAAVLRSERVAAVYDGKPDDRADLAELAAELGLPVSPTERPVHLEEVRSRTPAALAVLTSLADLHRGETVLVRGAGAPGTRLEVMVDGDGVALGQVRERNAE